MGTKSSGSLNSESADASVVSSTGTSTYAGDSEDAAVLLNGETASTAIVQTMHIMTTAKSEAALLIGQFFTDLLSVSI